MPSTQNKFIVQFRDNYYDLSDFALKHPGGVNTLKGLENSDMTNRFLRAPPHSNAAMYLMKEYRLTTDSKEQTFDQQIEAKASTVINGHRSTNGGVINGINGNRPQNHFGDYANNNVQLTDDSMEYLVDWSKPMLAQIPKIAQHYQEWVNKPVDRPLRLFGPWYLEMCTKTPWWVIPTFWIPVITYLLYVEYFACQKLNLSIEVIVINFLIGLIFWTFIEYSLHRWVFHMENKSGNPWSCTFHFLLHGLHHKVPFDPQRLVFPPFPAVILASIIYTPISIIHPYPKICLAGGLFGYLCYDLMHYYLHYGNPSMWHMYEMKRYHYQHHFVHHDLGFGISSPLWDFIFGTRIYLRKLKYMLRWKY